MSSFEIGDPAGATVGDDVFVYIGISDIDNAFHRMRMPEWLSDFFWLPFDFCACDLGLVRTLLGGQRLRHHDRVSVAANNLPMGLTWSLFFARKIWEHQMGQVRGMVDSKLFNDGTGLLVISPGRPLAMLYWVYVDNLGMICLSRVELQENWQALFDISILLV